MQGISAFLVYDMITRSDDILQNILLDGTSLFSSAPNSLPHMPYESVAPHLAHHDAPQTAQRLFGRLYPAHALIGHVRVDRSSDDLWFLFQYTPLTTLCYETFGSLEVRRRATPLPTSLLYWFLSSVRFQPSSSCLRHLIRSLINILRSTGFAMYPDMPFAM